MLKEGDIIEVVVGMEIYPQRTHIDGWSEGVVDYIREFERELS